MKPSQQRGVDVELVFSLPVLICIVVGRSEVVIWCWIHFVQPCLKGSDINIFSFSTGITASRDLPSACHGCVDL